MLSWTALRVRRLQLSAVTRRERPFTSKATRNEKETEDAIDDITDGNLIEDRAVLRKQVEHEETQDEEVHEPDLKPEDVRPPFTDAFAAVENDARTHRTRRHGNAALPLSPVIDPVFVAARNRWKATKAQPPEPAEMTEFQKKLYANVYGIHAFTS